ncbi:MAG: hypothetical protein KatS3mg010_2179 [Acidimicrobiia bacterium]|nr:MAG: hypothetical protein KatS3mg010_2179 [Acidimicrobiia bacterium]
MNRCAPPPGGTMPFDHHPEVWAAFNRYYGTLWSRGRRRPGDEGGRPPAERARHRVRDLQEPAFRGRA